VGARVSPAGERWLVALPPTFGGDVEVANADGHLRSITALFPQPSGLIVEESSQHRDDIVKGHFL